MRYLVVCLILALLVGCTGITGNVTAEETIKIGGLFALSGEGAEWGTTEMRAAQMAIDEANSAGGIYGKRIKFIIEDAKVQPKEALTAAQKLIAVDEVEVIIGPTWDEPAAAVIGLAEKEEVLVITGSISEVLRKENGYNYLYSTWYSDISGMEALASFMISKEVDDVVVFYNLNAWSSFIAETFKEKIGHERVIESYAFQDDVVDFRATLTKVREDKPDAIFFAFTTDATVHPFVKQAVELGFDIPLYTASQSEYEEIVKVYNSYPNNVYHQYPKRTEATERFEQMYEETYGERPIAPSGATAYDATKLVIAALEDGARTGPELVGWLETTEKFPGVGVKSITFENGLLNAGPDAFEIRVATEEGFKTVR